MTRYSILYLLSIIKLLIRIVWVFGGSLRQVLEAILTVAEEGKDVDFLVEQLED